MSARRIFVCAAIVLLLANAASASRFQRTKDGKTLVWNGQRGVAQEATWSGLRDTKGYATGEGTLIWYRLNEVVNSYTGKMVQGKFEGMVVKEQAGTRLQAKFANGEKAGDWSEPGSSATKTPTATSKGQSSKAAETQPTEKPVIEQPSSTPTLLPTPLPSPKLTATRSPSPSPTPTPSPSPSPTPTQPPLRTPSPSATPFPTVRSSAASPAREPVKKTSRLEEVVEGPIQDSLALASPSPSLRNALEEVPWPEPSASSASPTASPRRIDSKNPMIAEFKQQTKSVAAQVSEATGNFREIVRLDEVLNLPESVTASITALALRARDFRAKLGYDIAFHECRVETETVDALTVVDSIDRDFAGGNAPSARMTLLSFVARYPEPPSANQKPLWRYLTSALSLCDRQKNEAETHLQRAKSLASEGKPGEELREYQEINRIYPNPVAAQKIQQLEAQPR